MSVSASTSTKLRALLHNHVVMTFLIIENIALSNSLDFEKTPLNMVIDYNYNNYITIIARNNIIM